MNNEITVKVNVEVDDAKVDRATEKMEKLIALQKEYNRLAKGKKPYKPRCWEIIEDMKEGHACIKFGEKQSEKSLAKQKHFLEWLEKNTAFLWIFSGKRPTESSYLSTQFIYLDENSIQKNFFSNDRYNEEEGYTEIPFKYKDFPLD